MNKNVFGRVLKLKQKIGRRERLIRFIGREVGGLVLPPTRKRNDQAYNQNSRGVLRGGMARW